MAHTLCPPTTSYDRPKSLAIWPMAIIPQLFSMSFLEVWLNGLYLVPLTTGHTFSRCLATCTIPIVHRLLGMMFTEVWLFDLYL